MERFTRLICSALLALTICFGLTGTATADVNDFVITDFNGDYGLTREDPQGQLTITEYITVNFTDNNHGILRAIPLTYKGELGVKVLSVTRENGLDWPYTTHEENDNLVLKIGDPNSTVTGEQRFVVRYQVENVITFYQDHDELYWDINGDQWDQPFEKIVARFDLPADLRLTNSTCFTGAFKSEGRDCTVSVNEQSGDVEVSTGAPLGPRQTLTVVLGFPKGYFRPATTADWFKDHLNAILATTLMPLLVLLFAYRKWLKDGRDPKKGGVIIAEYGPPDDLTPAEVGAIVDYQVDNRDISATIIDLAIRGHIKIIETTKKKILKDQKEYSFELIEADFSKLKAHEKEILDGIFGENSSAGEVVHLKDLKKTFYTTAASVQKNLSESLTGNGYFAANPKKAGSGMLTFGGVLFFAAFFFRSFLSLGLIASAAVLTIFGVLMKKRSQKGVDAKAQIEGLKLYLQVAEKDRIKMLQSPDAPYMPKGPEPKRTVELFEKLLPYAVLLGVEKDWAKKFEGIYTVPPDWYNGNWRTFNAVYFASHLNSSVSAMGTNFSAPSSSGSSGFGGGGFSGGGGGGGGGGGW